MMACGRCGGLMVVETCCDLTEEESRMGMNSARCLNCGNLEDAVIYANRLDPRQPRRSGRYRAVARGSRAVRPDELHRSL